MKDTLLTFASVCALMFAMPPAEAAQRPVSAQQLRNLVNDAKPPLRFPFSLQEYGASAASISTYVEDGTPRSSCALIALQLAKSIMLGTNFAVDSVYVRFYDQDNRNHWIDVRATKADVKQFCAPGSNRETVIAALKITDSSGVASASLEGAGAVQPAQSAGSDNSVHPEAHPKAEWEEAVKDETRAREALDHARKELQSYSPKATAYNESDPEPQRRLQAKVDAALSKWREAQARTSRKYNAYRAAMQAQPVQGVTSDARVSLAQAQAAMQDATQHEQDARQALDDARKALRDFRPVLTSDDSFNSDRETQLQRDVSAAERSWHKARNEFDRAQNALKQAQEGQP
jgi:hypothetical protein